MLNIGLIGTGARDEQDAPQLQNCGDGGELKSLSGKRLACEYLHSALCTHRERRGTAQAALLAQRQSRVRRMSARMLTRMPLARCFVTTAHMRGQLRAVRAGHEEQRASRRCARVGEAQHARRR